MRRQAPALRVRSRTSAIGPRNLCPLGEPERIGEGARHACEIAVHAASTLEQLMPGGETSGEGVLGSAEVQDKPVALELFGDRPEDLA